MRMYFTLAILSALTLPTHAESVAQKIDQLIAKDLAHAHVGVMIADAQTGDVVYEREGNKLFSPASNMKLFTAAAALYHLGPEDRYTTSLSQYKNNLYITFSGSPSLSTKDLKDLVASLSTKGMKTITGDIILDSTAFQAPYHAAGISFDDLGWYYDAPSTAIILNGNAVPYHFISAPKVGELIQIKGLSTENPLTIVNNVRTVSKEEAKEHCNLNIEIKPKNTLRLYGCLSQREKPRLMHLSISDPYLYAKQLIQQTLKDNQIHLKGQIIEGSTPSEATVLVRLHSAPLTKLITHMLEESDNLYADSITKRLGKSLTEQGTYKQGAFAIKSILAKHTHVDLHQIEIADGAGTRYNVVTPQQMLIFLTDLYQDQTMKPIFINALPRMGATGTLKDRMKKTPLENKVFAKTGSMHDISALSGYLNTPSGKTYIFSIISNGINGQLAKAKAMEEKILLAVTEG